MSAVLQAWADLVAGTGAPPTNPHVRKQLIVHARNKASHSEEASRLEALKVLRRLGGADALSTAIAFVEDPSLELRQRLVRMAVEAPDDGRAVLRRMVSDPDPILAAEVIDRLIALEDRAATKRIRTLLQARHARVRARAAVFLGSLAGPSLVPFLTRHTDEDPTVRSVIAWAVARIEGRTDDPAPEPGQSWAPGLDEPPPEVKQPLASLPPPEPPPEPDTPSPIPAPPPAPRPAATSAVRPGTVPPKPSTDVDAVLALFHALGSGSDPGEEAVQTLHSADDRALSEAFRGRKPGGEASYAIGAARAAALLANPRWLNPIRRLSADPDANVRAAVATALGALCTPVAYNTLEALANEADPLVQAAAVAALAAAAPGLGYAKQARRLVESLPETKDETLLSARSAALETLGDE